MADKRIEFLRKLRDLLAEYSVSIEASYEGDTHGIYGERVIINHRPDPASFKEVEWLRLNRQTYLGSIDIEGGL